MAILGNELFVVSGKTSKRLVDVYNSNTFKRIRGITIQNSGSLWSIVAWKSSNRIYVEGCTRLPANNTLYISDEVKQVVHRYDLVKKNASMWKVGQACLGLSLTSSGNILVVLQDSKRIHEYTPFGELIQSMRLDPSIICSQHCICVSVDQYVISHIGSERRVCLVKTDEIPINSNGAPARPEVHKKGIIVKSYGGPQGSDIGQMDKPRHMVVDKQGYVLVADENNGRIELLHAYPKLSHCGYIEIPGDPLNGPRAICLDEENHRLYIGDTGRLLVLKSILTQD